MIFLSRNPNALDTTPVRLDFAAADGWKPAHHGERLAMMNGTTPADELQKLASRNGMKWESMGREVGMCYQAVMAMCKRHGYVKPHCKSFVFRGETASLMSHCKKYGLCNNTVIQYAQRNGISRSDALELYVTNQVKKHHWGVPQS